MKTLVSALALSVAIAAPALADKAAEKTSLPSKVTVSSQNVQGGVAPGAGGVGAPTATSFAIAAGVGVVTVGAVAAGSDGGDDAATTTTTE